MVLPRSTMARCKASLKLYTLPGAATEPAPKRRFKYWTPHLAPDIRNPENVGHRGEPSVPPESPETASDPPNSQTFCWGIRRPPQGVLKESSNSSVARGNQAFPSTSAIDSQTTMETCWESCRNHQNPPIPGIARSPCTDSTLGREAPPRSQTK